MKSNKRMEFIKSIRIASEEESNGAVTDGTGSNPPYTGRSKEEIEWQRKMDILFEELFGSASED